LLTVALIAYLVVTWALTLRPQPRYYLFAVYAATIAVALLAAGVPNSARARLIRAICIGLILLSGVVTIMLAPDRQRDARVILPWLKTHPGTVLHMAPKEEGRLAFPAILAGVRGQVTGESPPVGGLRIRMPRSASDPRPDPNELRLWRNVAILTESRLFPYINAPRTLAIEQRVR
jgi:hypothetical protein